MADLSTFRESESASATATAADAVKGMSPGSAWVFNEQSKKWEKPAHVTWFSMGV